ncbi:MAG: hypothetical protein J5I93_10110 [Pirellulaceae bacterium]|nr:hypothetical protein [Pirellulaceae bacterium]
MWKMNLRRGVRSWLHVFVTMAAVGTWLAFTASDISRNAAHAQEKLQAYPNEDFQASIVQLLAHRDRYHGKKIQIKGFLHVRFEDSAIYLSKDDGEHGITTNGFWVSFEKANVPFEGAVGPGEFDRKYVVIEGTFNARSRGHHSAWQGSIEKISRVVELKKGR